MVVVYSRPRRQLKNRLFVLGRGLFLGALLVLITTIVLPSLLTSKPEPIQQITFTDLLRIDADQAPEITEATFFTLDIPKINAKSRVVPNVNSADKFEYGQALSRGVAHAAGTYLPGMNGAVTLFAHSTDFDANVDRYNAVFYQLDELNPGDLVTIWYLGKKYDYKVTKTRVTPPTDVEIFKPQPGAEKLYLVTCTPRGTTKNRLIVEAEQI
jgi:LPXTG-site transpeptidase (sortase) family protein